VSQVKWLVPLVIMGIVAALVLVAGRLIVGTRPHTPESAGPPTLTGMEDLLADRRLPQRGALLVAEGDLERTFVLAAEYSYAVNPGDTKAETSFDGIFYPDRHHLQFKVANSDLDSAVVRAVVSGPDNTTGKDDAPLVSMVLDGAQFISGGGECTVGLVDPQPDTVMVGSVECVSLGDVRDELTVEVRMVFRLLLIAF
jgi:hypothetical protein